MIRPHRRLPLKRQATERLDLFRKKGTARNLCQNGCCFPSPPE